ncbi:uncharacterized protein [Nicotiana tomentosiformis]|uniref:uncharacterized protein n=1 Tax=Nicotiana tomentosiformis TaxID=4098 RepID=UPI00388C3B20
MRGHIQRECRASHQGTGRGTTQSSSPTAATSSAPPPVRGSPAPTGHDAARGGAQSSGGTSRFYVMSGGQSAEASPDIVTGISTVQSHDVYALIDPGSSLSYATPYVATSFGIEPEQLYEPFSVSTPIGESITAARVCRDCVVTVHGRDTMADIIELGMIDFDATKMIRKGYIYNLVRVTDTTVEVPTLESVPIVNDFPDVFSDELHGIPPDREIDMIPDTQPISIPPYRMAPA